MKVAEIVLSEDGRVAVFEGEDAFKPPRLESFETKTKRRASYKEDQRLLKQVLLGFIWQKLIEHDIKQVEMAKVLDINSQEITKIKRKETEHFSVRKLLSLVCLLGYDIDITLDPTDKRYGTMSFVETK